MYSQYHESVKIGIHKVNEFVSSNYGASKKVKSKYDKK